MSLNKLRDRDQPRRWYESPIAGPICGALSVGGLAAMLGCYRYLKNAKRQRPISDGTLPVADVEDINHQLGVIHSLCEIAKLKAESGPALTHRMDAAIDAVTETTALVRRLAADLRRADSADSQL